MNNPCKEDQPYFKFTAKSLISPLSIVLCVILVFRKQFLKRFFLVTYLFFSLQNSIIMKIFRGLGNEIKILIGQKSAQIKDHMSSNFWV